MLQKKSEYDDNDRDPDNVYVNIRIDHNSTRGAAPSLAQYDVTKTNPYLFFPGNFYCSVIGAAVPLDNLPLGIVRTTIDPGDPTNPNYMTAQIGITVPQGAIPNPFNTVTVNLQYIPNGTFPGPYPNPTPDNPNGQVITPYYYFYSYSTIIASFNNALQDAFSAQFPGGPVAVLGAPYFFMDYDTQLISLVVSDEFTTNADIYINKESLYYLQGFNLFQRPSYLDAQGSIFSFVYYKFNNNCDYYGQNFGTAGNQYWIYTQEYYAVQSIAIARKIIFTTNFIPINPEYVTVNKENGVQTGLGATSNILFQYVPKISTGGGSRIVNFFDSSYPRLVDLQGSSPISRIDLQIFWQDVQGDTFPLYISPYQAANIKLGFFRKSLFKNNWKKIRIENS